MSVEVRPLAADDGLIFRKILLDSLLDAPTAFGGDLRQEEAKPLSYWSEFSREVARRPDLLFLLAFCGDDVEPCGMARGNLDKEDPSIADLGAMWTRPSARRQGVGKEILDAVRVWAREQDVGVLALWVTEGNDTAIALYEREGFTFTGEQQFHPIWKNLRILRMQQALASKPELHLGKSGNQPR